MPHSGFSLEVGVGGKLPGLTQEPSCAYLSWDPEQWMTAGTQVASLGKRRDVLAPHRVTRRTGAQRGWESRNEGQEPSWESREGHGSPDLCVHSEQAQCDTMAGLQPVGSRRQAEKKTSGKGSAHIRKSAPESSNIACSTRYPGRHTETAR
ncbi:unnamed protein product [Rangifer tarandus platyrhynchus]|uniref:Uncharacterized protein n=1 Tax=Rangifer tarandus platyrhynchus TaxID=3082113 RepID=A0AC59Y4J5_RANTA